MFWIVNNHSVEFIVYEKKPPLLRDAGIYDMVTEGGLDMTLKGTADKIKANKRVRIETYTLDHLDLSVMAEGSFRLLNIKTGRAALQIGDADCSVDAPAVLCLDELKHVRILCDCTSKVQLINFDPSFLNANMQIKSIRHLRYQDLCQQHSLFQLSPFLTDDLDKMIYHLTDDTQDSFDRAFDCLTQNLIVQPDWYWSCRARSYFIDIIQIMEHLFHHYSLPEDPEPLAPASKFDEFKTLVAYIHNHLDEKHTLDSLYQRFRINKNQIERYFRDYLDTTFADYLRDQRFQEASYYLRFTGLNGAQIADRIGLSSSQNFCKFFRQITGLTPQQFRKDAVSRRKADADLKNLSK